MNFETIKLGFFNYLQELNESSEKEYVVNNSDVSIFMYASEFKSYVQEELNVTENILSMSINDILEMEIENGKLVSPEEDEEVVVSTEETENAEENLTENNAGTTEVAPSTEETAQTPDAELPMADGMTPDGEEAGIIQPDNTIITEILNTLFQEKEVVDALDTDKDGELNEVEITTFLNEIKELDGNNQDISLDDIFESIEAIKNDELNLGLEENINNSKSEEKIDKTDKTETPKKTSPSSNNGGGSYSGNSTSSKSSANKETKEKDINSMSKEELNKELDSAEKTFGEGQSILSSILDGTEDGLVAFQEAEDEAFKTYEEELKTLNEEMAKELEEKKTSVSEKEKEIDEKTQEISDQETVVSNAENTYNNAVSTRESLEGSLSFLESTDTSNMEEAQKAEISSKISNLKAKITDAKKAETEAKTAWDDAQEKLDELNKEKTKLDEECTKLNEDLTNFEQQILEQYPQIAEYQQAYNDAKTAKDEYKAAATEAIKKDLDNVQNYINEINTALTNIENKEKSKEYKINTFGDDVVDYAQQFIGANEADHSADKFLNGRSTAAKTPWCAAFVQYIMENSDGADDVPDWYKNIDKKWYCPNIAKAAKEADAYISPEEAKPGDIVLFDWEGDGKMNHVGIVVSNENGKLVTIEGNTSNKVAEKEYDTNDSRIKYCKMTD